MASDVKVEASLGQLAISLGVITVAQRDRMGIELFQRARKKTPTSFARLLLQGGLNAQKVQELLAFGAHLPAVKCDACELGIPQSQLKKREEVPCPRCGSLVLGFAAYVEAAKTPAAPPAAGGDEEDTRPLTAADAALAMADTTEKWKDVLPVPGAPPGAPRPGAGTDRWPGVLALPPSGAHAPTPPKSGAHALPPPRSGAHALPPPPPANDSGDMGGQTMMFGNVLPAPSPGTRRMFPDGQPANAQAPKLTPPSATGRPVTTPAPAETDRTLAFGDVFLLPGRTAPKTDAEVTDEMHTLLAPAGLSPLALQNGGTGGMSGDLLPPGFDPGAVTAPLQRDEIQAMLRQGPPPPRPKTSNLSNSTSGGAPIVFPSQVQPAPTVFLPPPTPDAPVPAAPPASTATPSRKTGKRAKKNVEAGGGRGRKWIVVLVLLLALAGGTATAWKLGLLPIPK